MALICALCTSTTDYNQQSINHLETFYTEFITTKAIPPLKGVGGNINVPFKTNVPSNWSICTNCFSSIQLLLKSKRAVDKVEFQVRKVQEKLLKELHSLSKEVDIMASNMTVVEGILKRNADDYFPSVWKEEDGQSKRKTKKEIEEETKLVENFRDTVINVFRNFQSFKEENNRKLLTSRVKVQDIKLPSKPREDTHQNSKNDPDEEFDNISNCDMDDNHSEDDYHDDNVIVKHENLDNNQDNISSRDSEDNHSSNSSSEDDEEFHPKKKPKSSVWKPNKSKKKSSLFTCDICLKPLKSGPALRAHIWSHLSPSEKEDPANEHLIPCHIYCKICRKEFPNKQHLLRHNAIHLNPEEREKIICQDCGIVVLSLSYPYHKRHHCIDSKTFSRHGVKCPICEELQKNTRVLVKHLVKAHPNDKHYPCDICGVRFRTKGSVHEHKKTHEEVGSFLCQGCGQRFKQNSNLKRHEKMTCPAAKVK